MAVKDGKGYLFPDPIDPQSLLCLKIYIPNDPRYLEAFSGQFHDLGYWLSWAKDGTNNAALVAQIWKDAIDYTYQNGWVNSCGDCGNCELCDMTKDELLELINEVLDMNVNVNCGGGSGCGCGGGSGSSQTVNLYIPPTSTGAPCLPLAGDPPPTTIPPSSAPSPVYGDEPEWETLPQFNATRCRIANYGHNIIKQWLARISEASNLAGTVSHILAYLVGIPLAMVTARLGIGQLSLLVADLFLWRDESIVEEIIEQAVIWWNDNAQEIICMAYSATDSAELQIEIVENMISGIVDILDDLPWWGDVGIDALQRFLTIALPPSLFSLMINATIPQAQGEQYPCDCGLVDIPAPAGFFFLPLANSHMKSFQRVAQSGGGVPSYTANINNEIITTGYQWTASPVGSASWTGEFIYSAILNDSRLPSVGIALAGMEARLISRTIETSQGAAQYFWRLVSQVGLDLYNPMYFPDDKGIVRSTDYPEISGWTGYTHIAQSNGWTGANPVKEFNIYMQGGAGTSGQHVMGVQYRWIVKL